MAVELAKKFDFLVAKNMRNMPHISQELDLGIQDPGSNGGGSAMKLPM